MINTQVLSWDLPILETSTTCSQSLSGHLLLSQMHLLWPYQKPCSLSWCGAYSFISNSPTHSLRVLQSPVIKSSIPSGNASCGLRGVGLWLLLRLPMVRHPTELSWVFIDILTVQASLIRSAIPSPAPRGTFTSSRIHHIG